MINLYNMDCMEAMAKIETNSVDAVVTDGSITEGPLIRRTKMCNIIHEDHRIPRKKTGKGWKIFSSYRDNALNLSMTNYSYHVGPEGWVIWDTLRYYNGGFCFMFSKREALRLARLWCKWKGDPSGVTIYRINYDEVIARQDETHVINGYTFDVGLCKRFKLIPNTAIQVYNKGEK